MNSSPIQAFPPRRDMPPTKKVELKPYNAPPPRKIQPSLLRTVFKPKPAFKEFDANGFPTHPAERAAFKESILGKTRFKPSGAITKPTRGLDGHFIPFIHPRPIDKPRNKYSDIDDEERLRTGKISYKNTYTGLKTMTPERYAKCREYINSPPSHTPAEREWWKMRKRAWDRLFEELAKGPGIPTETHCGDKVIITPPKQYTLDDFLSDDDDGEICGPAIAYSPCKSAVKKREELGMLEKLYEMPLRLGLTDFVRISPHNPVTPLRSKRTFSLEPSTNTSLKLKQPACYQRKPSPPVLSLRNRIVKRQPPVSRIEISNRKKRSSAVSYSADSSESGSID